MGPCQTQRVKFQADQILVLVRVFVLVLVLIQFVLVMGFDVFCVFLILILLFSGE